MRSMDAGAAGSSGRLRWPCRVPGSVDDARRRARRRRACAAKSSPETRSSSTSPLIMSVGGKCARSSSRRQARDRGERGAVDRAAEVVLVHPAHGVGAERSASGSASSAAAQRGIRLGLHGEQRRVGEHDERGRARPPSVEQAQRSRRSPRLAPALAPPSARRAGATSSRLERPARTRRRSSSDAAGSARRPFASTSRASSAHAARQPARAVVDRDDRDAAGREGAGDPVGLGHVEVAAGEAAAVRPDQARRRSRIVPGGVVGGYTRTSPSGRGVRLGHRRSGAPAGLHAADAVGLDLLPGSRMPRTRPSGRREGRATRATRRAPGARRCRTRP